MKYGDLTELVKENHNPTPQTNVWVNLDNITLTSEFKRALKLLEQGKNLFITGNAGTGKSTLLSYFRQTTNKRVVVVAPTGIAAINVGGQTIHSFFKFPTKVLKEGDIPILPEKIAKNIDVLIIDEISMVRADLMTGIDHSLRVSLRKPKIPFGGIQIIVIGDLFQLPPVVKGNDLNTYFNNKYGGPYFFNSPAFTGSTRQTDVIDLKTVFRQSNPDFINLLNGLRRTDVSDEVLEALNKRIIKNGENFEIDDYVYLTTTNKMVKIINQVNLNELKNPLFSYIADVKGNFKEKDFPTEEVLELKVGASVMFLRNDFGGKWVNGTVGTVAELSENEIYIRVNNDVHAVERDVWEKIEYVYDDEEKELIEKVVGSFYQYPLRLSWALTIHKSQGQTFNKIIVDLSKGSFAHGQTYVALSRCTSLEGLLLTNPIKKSDVIVDPRVFKYTQIFNMKGSK